MAPTLLLVEDNDDDAFAFNWVLKKCGSPCAVITVTDGQQAMDYLAGEGKYTDRAKCPMPALIFLDLKLPLWSGHEVLAWMRSRESLRDLPVVVLSGSDEERDHTQAAENGACGYLVKPISVDDLKKALGLVEGHLNAEP